MTKSPSRMPASIIESPRTRSMNSSPSPVKSAGHRQQLLDVLLGEHVGAGGDVADERHVAHRPPLHHGARSWVPADLDGPRLGRVAAEVAEALQRVEVAVHRRRRGQPDGLTDLADRGRVAAVAHLLLDEVEHLALAGGDLGALGPVGPAGRDGGAVNRLRESPSCLPSYGCSHPRSNICSARTANDGVDERTFVPVRSFPNGRSRTPVPVRRRPPAHRRGACA